MMMATIRLVIAIPYSLASGHLWLLDDEPRHGVGRRYGTSTES